MKQLSRRNTSPECILRQVSGARYLVETYPHKYGMQYVENEHGTLLLLKAFKKSKFGFVYRLLAKKKVVAVVVVSPLASGSRTLRHIGFTPGRCL